MSEAAKEVVLDAIHDLFKPLATVVISTGISHQEIESTLRKALVEVATADYGIRGRPTNISRVAAMTGLSRKEVGRIRSDLKDGEPLKAKHSPVHRVLSGWQEDCDFSDADGKPGKLPFRGESRSFEALVTRYVGDYPPGAIRTELQRIGCIETLENGDLSLVSGDYLSAENASAIGQLIEQQVGGAMQGVAAVAKGKYDAERSSSVKSVTVSVGDIDVSLLLDVWADRAQDLVQKFKAFAQSYEHLHASEKKKYDRRDLTFGTYSFMKDR